MTKPHDLSKDTNAVQEAYTWQNPQSTKLPRGKYDLKKVLMIIGGIVAFFGLAIILAFV